MTTPTAESRSSEAEEASLFTQSSTKPEVITLQAMIDSYLQEYEVRQFRINTPGKRRSGCDHAACSTNASLTARYLSSVRIAGHELDQNSID